MNKSQKTIVTLEIVLIVAGLIFFAVISMNSDGGQRKEITQKLTVLKNKLVEAEKKYSENPSILQIINEKKAEIDEMITGYNNKENEYDFAMETRRVSMKETDISCFIDECVKISDEIKDINAFIKKADNYLSSRKSDIAQATSHRKVPRSTRNEIEATQEELKAGLEKLYEGLKSSGTPEEFTQLSLEALDLGQPFVELQNKVEHALKLIKEKRVDTATKIDIKPIVLEQPKETRIKVKKSDPVLQEKVIPEYPDKFKGNGYFAIIGVKIGTDGKPKSTSVVRTSGNDEFDTFCREQAMGLKFTPAQAYYKDKPGEVFPIESDSQYPFKCN